MDSGINHGSVMPFGMCADMDLDGRQVFGHSSAALIDRAIRDDLHITPRGSDARRER
ncbi:MAG: hypothetical protein H6806_11880 [Planctomycetes bacterium]|nr:hypothetical protein [Planctomycetota bacterium]